MASPLVIAIFPYVTECFPITWLKKEEIHIFDMGFVSRN